MDFFVTVIVFVIVLFLYVHVTAQFKKSEDMEIYEMDYKSNSQLNGICEQRQPVLFEFKSLYPEFFDKSEINGDSINVTVKDRNDIETGDSITLPYSGAETLIKTDPKSRFYSENNTDLANEFADKNMDEFLKPDFNAHAKYDIMFGSTGSRTPVRYHTNSRVFISVKTGKIQVKMTPWKSKKYLHPINDYDNFEFRSPIDVWDPQPKFLHEVDKVRFLEFDVNAGYILYVPAYWFYSIKYSNQPTQLREFTYCTVFNLASNIPNYGMFFLQQNNIKKKVLNAMVSDKEKDVDGDGDGDGEKEDKSAL